jgi:uncharacterized phosphosugar-binding protein
VPASALEQAPPTLREFAARMKATAGEDKAIIASAERAAERTVANPGMLIDMPYGLQGWFAEELLNRAGGLANALPPEERPKLVTEHDLMLLAVRSWESDGEKIAKATAEWQAKGAMVVVFASRFGAPADLKADALIDNGAKTTSNKEAPVNAIVDIANAWMWCCEYNAALTRKGRFSPVLLSIFMPDGPAYDKKYQAPPRSATYPTDKQIAAGELTKAYRARVDKAIGDLATGEVRAGIGKAGALIADRLKAGGTVYVSTCTHFLLNEINIDNRTAIKPLRAVWSTKNAMKDVKNDDIVLWMGYYGMSTPYEDYGGMLRRADVKVIRSFAGKGNEADQKDTPLLQIAQPWDMPDADVAIPFEPGYMAPVSGVIQGLMWRMIEDETLKAMPAGK